MKKLLLTSVLATGVFLSACGQAPGNNENMISPVNENINSVVLPVETGSTMDPVVEDTSLRVTTPAPATEVTSPLEITGQASGWYFEGSFAAHIEDANGQILGRANATAQGDWMTSTFVPFTAVMDFDTPTTVTGRLVFTKANPSGIPENNQVVAIPVSFGSL